MMFNMYTHTYVIHTNPYLKTHIFVPPESDNASNILPNSHQDFEDFEDDKYKCFHT